MADAGWVLAYLAATVFTSAVAGDRSHLALFWAGCVAMALVALVLYQRDTLSVRALVVLGITARLAMLWLPPGLSDDAYRYLWDGFVQHAGLNPFAHRPADLTTWHDSALYPRLNSPTYFSVYPPLSQVLFWLVTPGSTDAWLANWYGWKGICLLAETGTLLLLGVLSRRAVLLYALQPLVVVEMVGQAHTEAVMVFGLALACRAMQRERVGLAGFGLAVATMVKLYPVLLFPFLIRSRRDARTLVLPVLGSLALAALYGWHAYLPNVLTSLQLYARYFEFNAGLYYALKHALGWISGTDPSKQLGPALALFFGFVYLLLIAHHARTRPPFARSAVWTLGTFLLLSTTVHPWYLAGVLVLLPFAGAAGWPWQFLALASLGTYMRYVDGPYAAFVWLGWGGALVLWLAAILETRRASPLQLILRRRGVGKAQKVKPWLPSHRPLQVLDLGAGEGYVGEALRDKAGADVTLADVIDLHRVDLPFVRLGEDTLPFGDDAFDVAVLAYVLHHTRDASTVLAEALRVSRRVVVLESVYATAFDHATLDCADRWANTLRSRGAMTKQEEHLHFRTDEEWRQLFGEMGTLIHVRAFGRWPHRQALYVLDR